MKNIIKNTPKILSIVLSLLTYFSDFTKVFEDFLYVKLLGIDIDADFKKIITLLIFFIFWALITFIFSYITKKIDEKNKMYQEYGDILILSSSSDGKRIDDFRYLRNGAKASLWIMDIGMTNISQDMQTIEKLLDRNIKIKILMINPNFILNNDEYNKNIDIYNNRHEYLKSIEISYKTIYKFIENRNKLNMGGNIEMRVYNSFIPINLTIADDINAIFEFIIPYSSNRLRFKFNKKDSKLFYNEMTCSLNKIWSESDKIISNSISSEQT